MKFWECMYYLVGVGHCFRMAGTSSSFLFIYFGNQWVFLLCLCMLGCRTQGRTHQTCWSHPRALGGYKKWGEGVQSCTCSGQSLKAEGIRKARESRRKPRESSRQRLGRDFLQARTYDSYHYSTYKKSELPYIVRSVTCDCHLCIQLKISILNHIRSHITIYG